MPHIYINLAQDELSEDQITLAKLLVAVERTDDFDAVMEQINRDLATVEDHCSDPEDYISLATDGDYVYEYLLKHSNWSIGDQAVTINMCL